MAALAAMLEGRQELLLPPVGGHCCCWQRLVRRPFCWGAGWGAECTENPFRHPFSALWLGTSYWLLFKFTIYIRKRSDTFLKTYFFKQQEEKAVQVSLNPASSLPRLQIGHKNAAACLRFGRITNTCFQSPENSGRSEIFVCNSNCWVSKWVYCSFLIYKTALVVYEVHILQCPVCACIYTFWRCVSMP